MTNTSLLAKKIAGSAVSKTMMAARMNMSMPTFYSRIAGKSEFSASEIQELSSLLHLTVEEREGIFFSAKGELNSRNEV